MCGIELAPKLSYSTMKEHYVYKTVQDLNSIFWTWLVGYIVSFGIE